MKPDMTGVFDEMVEALEENEDMVECKECFDLFPKAECEKSDVGYVCPVCKGLKVIPARSNFVDPYDCYTQDFPEVADYDSEAVIDYTREPGLGDALSDLIADEYEAIDGYEVADEKIQHTQIPEEEKDEILDTLDHIKEEEEEHIDELKDLCPECEGGKETSEELTEDMKSKITKYLLTIPPEKVQKISDAKCGSCDHELSAPDTNGISKCPACSNRYVNKQLLCCKNCGGDVDENRDFKCANCGSTATGNKSYNQCKTCGGDLDSNGKCNYCSGSGLRDLDKKKADKKDINTTSKNKVEALVEADEEPVENNEVSDLDSAYEAALEVANEKGVGQVFGYATEEDESFVAIEPFDVDDAEAVEDDLRAVYDDVKYAYVAYPESTLEEALFESTQLQEGPGRFLKGIGQKIGNAAKHLANKDSGKVIDEFFNEGYVLIFEGPKENGKMPKEHKEEYATADQALTAALHLSKEYPKHKVWVFAKPIDTSDLTPREKNLASVKNGLGAMIACFKNGKADQKKDKEIADTLKKIEVDKQDLLKTTGKTAGKDQGDPRDSMGEEESEDTDEDEDLDLESDDPKSKLKAILGEKKDPDGYTADSYTRYESLYEKIVAWIEGLKKPELVTEEKINSLKSTAESKLVVDPDASDADLDLEGEDGDGENSDLSKVLDKIDETLTEYRLRARELKVEAGYEEVAATAEQEIMKLAQQYQEQKSDIKTAEDASAKLSEIETKCEEIWGKVKKDEGSSEEERGSTDFNKKYHGVAASNNSIQAFRKLMMLTGMKVYDAMGDEVTPDLNGAKKITAETLNDFEVEVKGERQPLAAWIAKMVKVGALHENFGTIFSTPLTEADKPETTQKTSEKDYLKSQGITDNALASFKKLFALTDLKVYDAFDKPVPADKNGMTKMSSLTLVDFTVEYKGKKIPLIQFVAKLAKEKIIKESLCKAICEGAEFEEVEEGLQSEADAVKSLKNTSAILQDTVKGMKNMTNAMREEYHKYANPAELVAMDNLKVEIDKIVKQVVADLVAAGYDDLDCYDSDCYMSGNNTCTITMFIGSEDTFEDGEAQDLQDHMTDLVEEALSQIKLPPELVEVQGGALFPDDMIMDEDDKANGLTRGEITVEVTFARNLM